jgi:hypothetical protein
VEANSTGGQGSRRAVAPSDDDDDDNNKIKLYCVRHLQMTAHIVDFPLTHSPGCFISAFLPGQSQTPLSFIWGFAFPRTKYPKLRVQDL